MEAREHLTPIPLMPGVTAGCDPQADMAKPGDRVAVAGVFKAVAPRAMGTLQGTLRASLVANHVRQLNTDASLGSFTTGARLLQRASVPRRSSETYFNARRHIEKA